MHHANHFYGHAHIMAQYAGFEQSPRIWGYLQHGWNILDGFAVGTAFGEGMPKFVWSDSVRRRGHAMGRRNYAVVGAPWMYLLELEPELATQPPDAAGTIFYPFHGWEGQHVVGSHDELVREIKDNEEGPVTICLYWHEYAMREVRDVYQRAGFDVITHGYRGLHWRDTDHQFLFNQLKVLRTFRRVASNRMSSAIFYGASLGLQPGVYGDPMVLQDESASFGGMARMRRLWPEMHQPYVPMDYARATTRTELGADRLARPEAIRELFGWPRNLENSCGQAPGAQATQVDGS